MRVNGDHGRQIPFDMRSEKSSPSRRGATQPAHAVSRAREGSVDALGQRLLIQFGKRFSVAHLVSHRALTIAIRQVRWGAAANLKGCGNGSDQSAE